MTNDQSLKKLYIDILKNIHAHKDNSSGSDKELIKIILEITENKYFHIFHNNNFDFEYLSDLFRHYEDVLCNLHNSDTELFEIRFELYLILIELFKLLCTNYSTNPLKRGLVEPISEILIESKNILKLRIPLEKEKIDILNDCIGQQRYKFSHQQYIKANKRDLNNIFEVFLLNCERMYHGFKLSESTNFSNDKSKKTTENMIFTNNIAFLLLKMVFKIKFFYPGLNYDKNPYFCKIIEFCNSNKIFSRIMNHDKNIFKQQLFDEFRHSMKYLKKKNLNVIEEKIQLLSLNTDEYKQLIDIINLQND